MSATSLPRVPPDLALPVVCRLEGFIAMPLNPSPSNALMAPPLSCHFPFSHFYFLLPLTPFRINTYGVASKELTGSLSPLYSALTKNRGGGGVIVNQKSEKEAGSRRTVA